MLAIPLKLDSAGGGATGGAASYADVIDGSLDLYSAQVKNYPVADAFTIGIDTSQEFWGLQGVTARNSQNTARQGLLSFGIAQGTGVLSRKSIVPMSRSVKEILGGNVRFGVYVDFEEISLDGSYGIGAQEGTARGLAFNGDGTKVYTIGQTSDRINQYSLTTAYDVTGIVTFDGFYSVSAQESFPESMCFNGDGTKVYVVGQGSDRIYQYSLTTAYDITSTVTLDGSYNIATQEGQATGMCFNGDGTKVYTIGQTSDRINQYSLTTAYDVTGIVTFDGFYSVSTEASDASGLNFNGDGTKIYIIDQGSSNVYQYSLTTAYDVTGTVTLDGSYNVSGFYDIIFNNDGSKFYTVNNNIIYQYATIGDQSISFDVLLDINGNNVFTQSISENFGGFYELIDITPSSLPFLGNISLSGEVISAQTIIFEAQVANVVNSGSLGIKLGFGLTGGDYTTPTGNYEVSTLDLLL